MNWSKIKKRILSFILAGVLSVSMCVTLPNSYAENTTYFPDTLTPEMALAFSNKLLTYHADDDIPDYENLYAVVETLGTDHYPVLRVIDNVQDYVETIWLYQDGQLVQAYYGGVMDRGGDKSGFFLSEVDGVNYYVVVDDNLYGFAGSSYINYQVYTVKSGQWILELNVSKYNDIAPISALSDYLPDQAEQIKLLNKINAGADFTMATSGGYIWSLDSNRETPILWGEPAIYYSKTYTVDANGNETPITADEYNHFISRYENQKDLNGAGSINLDNLSTWTASTKDELFSPHELAHLLQEYYATSGHYNLQDSISDLSERDLTEMEEIIQHLCKENSGFEVGYTDNSELLGLVDYLVMSEVIGEFSHWYEDYGVDIVPCETINRFMNRILGRTVDFTPYQREQLPIKDEICDELDHKFSLSLVYDDNYYQYYLPRGYDLSWFIEMKHLYNVSGNIFLAESVVWEGDYTPPYRGIIGKVAAIFEKRDNAYRLVKIYPFNEFPDLEEVQRYIISIIPESNFQVDYRSIAEFANLSQYVDALRSALTTATSLNDAGNSAVTSYFDYVIQNCKPATIKVKNNIVFISPNIIQSGQETASKVMDTLQAELNGLTLQRTPTITTRIDVTGLDYTKPIRVKLDETSIAATTGLDNIVLMLGDNQHVVSIPVESVCQLGSLDLQLERLDEYNYRISFFDSFENVIDHLDANITFTLPASSEFSSIQAICSGYTDNWGGQFDSQNNTITFQTPYSGEYAVLDQTIQLIDIDYLPAEVQEAIRFMVSKGVLDLDAQGNFNPSVGLNRYEFSQALVKIFFTLNRDAIASFSDVERDNPFYPYVASGEENKILAGYDDGTFHGEDNIQRVQMAAICGRTLANKKNYARPTNAVEYLNYVDLSDIPGWAIEDVALAVREGLFESGGTLRPNQAINRGEAALALYRLFMLLYEVSPTPLTIIEAPNVSNSSISPVLIGGGIIVAVGGVGMATYFILGKKKSSNKGG